MNDKAKPAKTVLFIPNTRWFDKRPWVMMSQGVVILTALLRDRFEFSILDANIRDLSEEECLRHLSDLQPELVLVPTLSVEYYQQYHKACEISKRACPAGITVMGGVYPTVLWENILDDANVDYIFLGHAEERLENFLNIVRNKEFEKLENFAGIGYRKHEANGHKAVIYPVKTYIADVKQHVQPDYSLLDVEKYLHVTFKDYQFNTKELTTSIMTSYGCPYNCVFCASKTISGQRTTFRPIEDVLAEMEYFMNQHNVRQFVFLDDEFLADRKRIEYLLEEMQRKKFDIKWKIATVAAWHLDDEILEKIKIAGCTQITVSIESGCQRVLREIVHKPLKLSTVPPIVKKCRELGIDIGANVIIGFPGETWDEIRETLRFAEICDFDLVHIHIATPLPRTELYRISRDMKLLPEDFSFTDPKYFGFGQGFITTEEFTPNELMILRAFEWDRINFSSKEKTEKVAQLMNLSIEELEEHRKKTRQKFGIHF